MPVVTTPICPRCAYDLSGDVASWKERCPLEGRCSECGLDFLWSHVVSDQLRPPRWSYEHAARRWLMRVPSTWTRARRPRRFWRDLRLEHRVNARRLAIVTILLLVTLHTLSGVVAMLVAAWSQLTALAWMPAARGSFTPTLVEVAWDEHRHFLLSSLVIWDPGAGRFWRGPFGAAWLASLGAVVVAFPVAMMLLPQTFRAAKVRRVHVFRAFAHTLPIVGEFAIIGVALAAWIDSRLYSQSIMWCWLVAIPGIVWTAYAWRCITRHYLRLPQPDSVWLAVSIIAILTTAIVAATLLAGEMHILVRSWRL